MEICDQCGSFGEIQALCGDCGKIICSACSGGFDRCNDCRKEDKQGGVGNTQQNP